MSKKKPETSVAAAAVQGLLLVVIAGPTHMTLEQLTDLSKGLEELGHKIAPPFTVTADEDRYTPVHDDVSNVAHILTSTVGGVLLMPHWVDNPTSRTEVFAAVNTGLNLYALAYAENKDLDSSGWVLTQIDPWAVLMTIAQTPAFKEAAAIYAPLPTG